MLRLQHWERDHSLGRGLSVKIYRHLDRFSFEPVAMWKLSSFLNIQQGQGMTQVFILCPRQEARDGEGELCLMLPLRGEAREGTRWEKHPMCSMRRPWRGSSRTWLCGASKKKKNVELTFAGPRSSLGSRAISYLISHFNRKTE